MSKTTSILDYKYLINNGYTHGDIITILNDAYKPYTHYAYDYLQYLRKLHEKFGIGVDKILPIQDDRYLLAILIRCLSVGVSYEDFMSVVEQKGNKDQYFYARRAGASHRQALEVGVVKSGTGVVLNSYEKHRATLTWLTHEEALEAQWFSEYSDFRKEDALSHSDAMQLCKTMPYQHFEEIKDKMGRVDIDMLTTIFANVTARLSYINDTDIETLVMHVPADQQQHYIEARKAGFSHDEIIHYNLYYKTCYLQDLLPYLNEDTRDDLTINFFVPDDWKKTKVRRYTTSREAGATHNEAMEALQEDDYAEYREAGINHKEALDLIKACKGKDDK